MKGAEKQFNFFGPEASSKQERPSEQHRRPMWSEQERPSSSHRIRQTYTGHGVAVPPPLDLGFAEGVPRPPSAPAGPPPPDEAAASALAAAVAPSGRKSKKKPPPKRLLLRVHLREKVLPIQVAEGKQCVFWLGVLAVQRYVVEPDSYSSPFSEELTPKCVRTPGGEILDGHARICDELADGEHVIVDVGDGTPLSLVESRPFGEVLYQPEVNPEHEEVIEWEQHAENKRQSMRYSRIKVAARLSFDEWRARNTKTSEEELWEKFMAIWDAMRLNDLPGHPHWLDEVRATLWRHFERLTFIFVTCASRAIQRNSAQLAEGPSIPATATPRAARPTATSTTCRSPSSGASARRARSRRARSTARRSTSSS